jgi:hypothetical protein
MVICKAAPSGELVARAIQTFALARVPTCQKKLL